MQALTGIDLQQRRFLRRGPFLLSLFAGGIWVVDAAQRGQGAAAALAVQVPVTKPASFKIGRGVLFGHTCSRLLIKMQMRLCRDSEGQQWKDYFPYQQGVRWDTSRSWTLFGVPFAI
jgi:hypothetical protein